MLYKSESDGIKTSSNQSTGYITTLTSNQCNQSSHNARDECEKPWNFKRLLYKLWSVDDPNSNRTQCSNETALLSL
jgi:hypothetical protein